MHMIRINGATYPKVTDWRTGNSKLGQRLIFKQANGVRHSILLKDVERIQIERELDVRTGD